MNTTLDSRPGPASAPPRAARRGQHDLVDDLGRGQVAGQPALAGGAERAGHAAAGLAGHAHGDPVRVAHQHALDQRAVVRRHSVLRVAPSSQAMLAHRGQQRWAAGAGEPCRGLPAGRSVIASGRGPAGRSSGGPAARRGTRARRAPGHGARRPARSRSARWRGGVARLGASNTRGRAVMTHRLCQARPYRPAGEGRRPLRQRRARAPGRGTGGRAASRASRG